MSSRRRSVLVVGPRAWVLVAVGALAAFAVAQGIYLTPPRARVGLAGLESRVRIERAVAAPDVDASTPSPHGGGWFVPYAPAFVQEPPWTTVVEVGGRAVAPWRLELVDHANVDVRVVWVTEQLLLVEVWWGRTVSSELLFDARGELLHATTYAWYGATFPGDVDP